VSINSNNIINIPHTENTFPELLLNTQTIVHRILHSGRNGLKRGTGQFTSADLDLSLPNLVL